MADGFYEQLAADYDRMIPWAKRLANERPLFEALWRKFNVHKLLDASCGTGRHLVMFSEMGLDVTGSDGSPEMISLAKRNSEASANDLDTQIHLARWEELPQKVPGCFDAVLCIGNSLPYVTELDALQRSLEGLWAKVADPGVLIIQFKNFPKLQATRQRFLPLTSSEQPDGEMVALRLYDYHEDHIDFNVILLSKRLDEGWSMRHQMTALRPYHPDEVGNRLRGLGADVALHGSLRLDEYDPLQSEDVVLVCRRQKAR